MVLLEVRWAKIGVAGDELGLDPWKVQGIMALLVLVHLAMLGLVLEGPRVSSPGQYLLQLVVLATTNVAAGFQNALGEVASLEQGGMDMLAHWAWAHPPHLASGVGLEDSGSSWWWWWWWWWWCWWRWW